MRGRNSATCDLLINSAPILTFNLTITVAVLLRSMAPVYSPRWASSRLLATFEEWADPRCQTILERCAIVLPCRGRLAPPAQGMTLPASHASTLPLHVLSHHSTNIVSVAANFFRPHTKESLSLSWRTLDTTSGLIKCALPTPGASNPRRPDSDTQNQHVR